MPAIDWNWLATVVIAPAVVAAVVSGAVNVYLARKRERSEAQIALVAERFRVYAEFEEAALPLRRTIERLIAERAHDEEDVFRSKAREALDEVKRTRVISTRLSMVNVASGKAAWDYCNACRETITALLPPYSNADMNEGLHAMYDAETTLRHQRNADLRPVTGIH